MSVDASMTERLVDRSELEDEFAGTYVPPTVESVTKTVAKVADVVIPVLAAPRAQKISEIALEQRSQRIVNESSPGQVDQRSFLERLIFGDSPSKNSAPTRSVTPEE